MRYRGKGELELTSDVCAFFILLCNVGVDQAVTLLFRASFEDLNSLHQGMCMVTLLAFAPDSLSERGVRLRTDWGVCLW
jgi:hypothetical protein